MAPVVVYFNSCQVHNDPLKAAVRQAGARTFVGGITNLLIGPSEDVCRSFWEQVLTSAVGMADALHTAEKAKYPNEGAHGICGDLGQFGPALQLAHAMWVHGHALRIEYPDRIEFLQPMGFYVRAKGKPFTSNWFHWAVPTPVIVDGQRLRVGSVLVRYRTTPGASIECVDIYDGERKIYTTGPGLHASAVGGFATPRFDIPTHPPVLWGLGVSVAVSFGDSANLPPDGLSIDVASVGCDFVAQT